VDQVLHQRSGVAKALHYAVQEARIADVPESDQAPLLAEPPQGGGGGGRRIISVVSARSVYLRETRVVVRVAVRVAAHRSVALRAAGVAVRVATHAAAHADAATLRGRSAVHGVTRARGDAHRRCRRRGRRLEDDFLAGAWQCVRREQLPRYSRCRRHIRRILPRGAALRGGCCLQRALVGLPGVGGRLFGALGGGGGPGVHFVFVGRALAETRH